MDHYFTDDLIIAQVCKERIKLADQRDGQQYLTHLIGRRNPRLYPNELNEILPPRRQWNQFRPRHRSENGNGDLVALRKAVRILREQQPDLPWVINLNQFIAVVRERIFGSAPFSFTNPHISWVPKKGNEYRALCLFSLQNNVIACLFANYVRAQFDAGFSSSSFAFRSRDTQGNMPTHHDAFNQLFELKQSQPKRDLYVAECDIRGFFDTVDHEVALAAFDTAAQRVPLHHRAQQIFRAYLDCYNFQVNVLAVTEPRLKEQEGQDAHFPWPKEALVNPASRVLGVPQGGAVSGVIANLVLDAADKAVEQVRQRLGAEIHYYRYCDDMILVSPVKKHCELAFKAYLEALHELKLPYHRPEKTWIYGRKHWEHKSKAVYCWSGRKSFCCVPWIQFVGYQLRYDGLARSRKGAFKSQAEKFVDVTNEVKFGLLRAGCQKPIIASRSQVLRSFAYRLMAKGVGRIAPYTFGPRPMSWSAGLKALNEKPIITGTLKHLDRLRQKQITRFAAAQINYGQGRGHHGWQGWNPIGYLKSYFAQFKNVGGRELIENPWHPENWKERVMAKLFDCCKELVCCGPALRKLIHKLKKRVRNHFTQHVKIEAGEQWSDSRFRANHIYEVLEVGWSVKCRNHYSKHIRYIPRALFTQGRFTKLTDRTGRFV